MLNKALRGKTPKNVLIRSGVVACCIIATVYYGADRLYSFITDPDDIVVQVTFKIWKQLF